MKIWLNVLWYSWRKTPAVLTYRKEKTDDIKRCRSRFNSSSNHEIYIRKVAPLGDPVEITVRGYELSVRKNDAECVQVK